LGADTGGEDAENFGQGQFLSFRKTYVLPLPYSPFFQHVAHFGSHWQDGAFPRESSPGLRIKMSQFTRIKVLVSGISAA
jgi:hypothetical protein